MSFQSEFTKITNEKFRDGCCHMKINDYPFTVKVNSSVMEIKFPLSQKRTAPISAYHLSSSINEFLEKEGVLRPFIEETECIQNNSSMSSEDNTALITDDIPVDAVDCFNGFSEIDQNDEPILYEWDNTFYHISFSGIDDKYSPKLCTNLINHIADTLAYLDIRPNTCVFCGEHVDNQDVLIEGILCSAHKECLSAKHKIRTPFFRRILAYLVAIAFCAVASIAFIPLCILGIMPSVAGIPMGLLSAFGFWLMCKDKHPNKLIMVIVFIITGGLANFSGDYLYLVRSGEDFDLLTTLTFRVNIINTVFDVLSCTLIAHFSSIIIYDLFYKKINVHRLKSKTNISSDEDQNKEVTQEVEQETSSSHKFEVQ